MVDALFDDNDNNIAKNENNKALGLIRESPENESMTDLLQNQRRLSSSALEGDSEEKFPCGCSSHREYVYIDQGYFMTLEYLYALLFNHNTEIRTIFLKEKGCQGST